jgi:hypothetical protein
MVPHERSLVEKFQDRPFVLVGVNSDPEREIAQDAQAKHAMAWRSWWDGADGPIAAEWKIKFFPTTYVIDSKGVIRYANLRGAELEQAIETLLQEMPAK